MSKQVAPSLRKAVKDRARFCCECCGRHMAVMHLHHRKLKSQGGEDSLSNLLGVLPQCHALIHRFPAASYALGHLVKSYNDPAEVPVVIR